MIRLGEAEEGRKSKWSVARMEEGWEGGKARTRFSTE